MQLGAKKKEGPVIDNTEADPCAVEKKRQATLPPVYEGLHFCGHYAVPQGVLCAYLHHRLATGIESSGFKFSCTDQKDQQQPTTRNGLTSSPALDETTPFAHRASTSFQTGDTEAAANLTSSVGALAYSKAQQQQTQNEIHQQVQQKEQHAELHAPAALVSVLDAQRNFLALEVNTIGKLHSVRQPVKLSKHYVSGFVPIQSFGIYAAHSQTEMIMIFDARLDLIRVTRMFEPVLDLRWIDELQLLLSVSNCSIQFHAVSTFHERGRLNACLSKRQSIQLSNLKPLEWISNVLCIPRENLVCITVGHKIFVYSLISQQPLLIQVVEPKESEQITALHFHNEFKYLIAGTYHGVLHVWNLMFQFLHKMHVHKKQITTITSKDKTLLITASVDGVIRVIDANLFLEICSVETTSDICALQLELPDQMLVISSNAISYWTLSFIHKNLLWINSEITTMVAQGGHLGFPQRILFGAYDGVWRFLLPESGKVRCTCMPAYQKNKVHCVAHSVVAEQVVFLMAHGEIWIARTDVNPATFTQHWPDPLGGLDTCTCIAIVNGWHQTSTQSRLYTALIAGTLHGAIILFGRFGAVHKCFVHHKGAIARLIVDEKTLRAATLGEDMMLQVWQLDPTSQNFFNPCFSLTFEAMPSAFTIFEDKITVCVETDTTLYEVDYKTSKFKKIKHNTSLDHASRIVFCERIPRATAFLTLSESAEMRVWSMKNQLIRVCHFDKFPQHMCTLDYDGTIVYAIGSTINKITITSLLSKEYLIQSEINSRKNQKQRTAYECEQQIALTHHNTLMLIDKTVVEDNDNAFAFSKFNLIALCDTTAKSLCKSDQNIACLLSPVDSSMRSLPELKARVPKIVNDGEITPKLRPLILQQDLSDKSAAPSSDGLRVGHGDILGNLVRTTRGTNIMSLFSGLSINKNTTWINEPVTCEINARQDEIRQRHIEQELKARLDFKLASVPNSRFLEKYHGHVDAMISDPASLSYSATLFQQRNDNNLTFVTQRKQKTRNFKSEEFAKRLQRLIAIVPFSSELEIQDNEKVETDAAKHKDPEPPKKPSEIPAPIQRKSNAGFVEVDVPSIAVINKESPEQDVIPSIMPEETAQNAAENKRISITFAEDQTESVRRQSTLGKRLTARQKSVEKSLLMPPTSESKNEGGVPQRRRSSVLRRSSLRTRQSSKDKTQELVARANELLQLQRSKVTKKFNEEEGEAMVEENKTKMVELANGLLGPLLRALLTCDIVAKTEIVSLLVWIEREIGFRSTTMLVDSLVSFLAQSFFDPVPSLIQDPVLEVMRFLPRFHRSNEAVIHVLLLFTLHFSPQFVMGARSALRAAGLVQPEYAPLKHILGSILRLSQHGSVSNDVTKHNFVYYVSEWISRLMGSVRGFPAYGDRLKQIYLVPQKLPAKQKQTSKHQTEEQQKQPKEMPTTSARSSSQALPEDLALLKTYLYCHYTPSQPSLSKKYTEIEKLNFWIKRGQKEAETNTKQESESTAEESKTDAVDKFRPWKMLPGEPLVESISETVKEELLAKQPEAPVPKKAERKKAAMSPKAPRFESSKRPSVRASAPQETDAMLRRAVATSLRGTPLPLEKVHLRPFSESTKVDLTEPPFRTFTSSQGSIRSSTSSASASGSMSSSSSSSGGLNSRATPARNEAAPSLDSLGEQRKATYTTSRRFHIFRDKAN